MNCFKSFRTKSKLEIHKKMCESHDYCYAQRPNDKNKVLEYKQGHKSLKLPFIIYSDLECILEKTNTDQNKSPIRINKHTPCGYTMYTHCSFDTTKNN